MNTTAMEQMAKYYWGASRGVAGTTSLRSTWPPATAAHGAGEPSWEEQAFARDAAGHLGGCVWPPRSYTCSFCRREFRSAQALGGHMNVHRRDRARLRQCASPDHDAVQDTQQQQPRPIGPDRHPQAVLLPSPKSTGDHPLNKDHAMMNSTSPPSYISTIIKESKNKAFISMPAATVREAGGSGDDEEEEEEGWKRRRVDQPPAVVLPFLVRPSASCEREGLRGVDRDAKVPKELVASPSSTSLHLVGRQEVDLELRLGASPKVA